jgi:hypothetical protein
MNTIRYTGLGLVALLALNACDMDNWLDVNDNPNTPTQVVASVDSRLPWIQHHYGYGCGTAALRTSFITGQITSRSGFAATSMHTYMPAWDPINGISTSPYQQWFVGAAANLEDLIQTAEAEGAYHYIGAALTLHAMGFMMMTDLYGEMPYTEALGAYLTPKYDDGKTIFEGCLAKLDEALTWFDRTQEPNATPLSKGDSWNGGDVAKWKALIYGMKARWLNNLSKKSIYNPDAVLEALAKGPATAEMSTVINHVNDPGDTGGDVLIGDPLKTSYLFDNAAWSDHIRLTKYYTDMFEYPQAGGPVVYDPRREHLLPMNQHYRADGSSWFMVTEGVDIINTDIQLQTGPVLQNYNPATRTYSVSDAGRSGDTVYVTLKGVCIQQGGAADESFYQAGDGTILSTGTFYTLPESPTHVMTHYEMNFIKAEALFRKGDKAGALAAYKEAVRGHFELMNNKLKEWGAAQKNPGKYPMDEEAIAAFLASDCLTQTAGELTMAEIMKQKYIALSFHQQTWNDMRRFNYSAGDIGGFGVVYPGMDRPRAIPATAASQKFPGASKTDINYWWRRLSQCPHEVNYNAAQLKASHPKAESTDIWSAPVWWDTAD